MLVSEVSPNVRCDFFDNICAHSLVVKPVRPRWVLMAMVVVVGSLVPEDRLELTPSIVLSSATWAVLMHPGSTNSSGVIRVAALALGAMMRRQHPVDIAAAQAAHDAVEAAAQGDAAAEADAGEQAPAAKKRKFVSPPQRQILAGGGSLAAVGMFLVDVPCQLCDISLTRLLSNECGLFNLHTHVLYG